jgi:hypothetical protein
MRLSLRLGIALPLILLAWPAAAQAPQAVSIADPRTGCRVWNDRPQPQETIDWSGICAGGFAQGSGVLQWYWAGWPTQRYEGELRDGRRDGRGVTTAPNGARYEGEFHDGKADGRGVATAPNGERYEGEFRDGRRDGRGAQTWPNGERYEGEWRDDKANGRGVFTDANGRYEGEFRDWKKNGRGVMTWRDGARYEGDWRNGGAEGLGVFVYPSGQIVNGNWHYSCLRLGAGDPDPGGLDPAPVNRVLGRRAGLCMR